MVACRNCARRCPIASLLSSGRSASNSRADDRCLERLGVWGAIGYRLGLQAFKPAEFVSAAVTKAAGIRHPPHAVVCRASGESEQLRGPTKRASPVDLPFTLRWPGTALRP